MTITTDGSAQVRVLIDGKAALVSSVNTLTGDVVLDAAAVGADPAGTAATEAAAAVAAAFANRYGTPWLGISALDAPNNTFFDLTGVFFDIAAGETIHANLTVVVTTATAATLRASVCTLIWVATRNTAGDIVVANINPDAGAFNRFEVECVQDGATRVKIVMKRQGTEALIFHVVGEIFRNVIL